MRIWLLVAILLGAAPAHAAYFGKNKVQYRDLHWRVLETPHFAIHFYDREEPLVQDAARLAERAYSELAATLEHEFTHRIPVVLYASHADFQQTNITDSFIDIGTGGVTDLLRRRVFLPFTGSWAELEHVLTHELVHAFELDILDDPRTPADPASPIHWVPPLWVMEGLAEYLSRPAHDPHTDMWVRDACLSATLPSIENLAWVQDIRVYRLGQSIWAYFANEYGRHKIDDLLIAMRDRKSLDGALQQVAQVSLSEFSDRWRTAMRRRHLPAIAERQLTREYATATLTRRADGGSMILGAVLSPDGERIAYVSDRRLNHELWVRSVTSAGDERRLVEGETSGDFESLRFFSAHAAWSPDGETIAVSAKAGGEDALYLLDSRTGEVQARLAFGLDEVQTATFSPDGSELVFVGLAAGKSDLYRVHRDGSGLRRVTDDRYAERDPQWSPDGRTILYVTDEGPGTDLEALRFGRMHLALLDLEDGTRRDITPFATGKAVSPAWSGDGQYVAFVSDRDGTSDLYILHLPTGQVFRLTESATGISGILPTSPALSWARATGRLVFSSFGDFGWDVYRIDDPIARLRPLELDPGELAALPDPEPLGATFAVAAADSSPMVAAAGVPPRSDAGSGDFDPASFRVRSYRAKLRPDLSGIGAVAGSDMGFAGVSRLQFTDLLGNYHLDVGVGIYGSLKESDLSVAFTNRSRRTNYSLSAFQLRRRYGMVGAGGTSASSKQTYRGIQVGAARPFDKFRRVEGTLRLAGVEGRFFLGETVAEFDTDPEIATMRYFVGPEIAYVVDSALWGHVGPIKGRRLRLSAEGGFGELRYGSLNLDWREYWNLRRWYTVAGRFYGAGSFGPTPETFYLGGAQTLRGHDYGTLIGNRAMLASLEFRFPLLQHLALGWPLPLEFGRIQGALFADAATAWDSEWFRTTRALEGRTAGRRAQLATGLGMRANLGAIVLKVDWARLHDTGSGHGRWATTVALGTDF